MARLQSGVTLEWEKRSFRDGKGWIMLPFPNVSISPEIIEQIARATGLQLDGELTCQLKLLVERRIFNVCGFTSFGAAGNESVVPARARSAAKRVAELARDLITAMGEVDKVTGGKNNLDGIVRDLIGVEPRPVISAIAKVYKRHVPTAPAMKRAGRAVFMADLRDRVLKPAWSKQAVSEASQPSIAQLCKLIAAVDRFVFRPIDQCGIALPDGPLPIRRRKKGDPLRAELFPNAAEGHGAMEKAISRELRRYDQKRAATQASWDRAIERASRTKMPG
jgi:hypothetical protein